VLPSPEETLGYALVDVANNLGRYVRWHLDGSTDELATRVVRGMGDLLVNYDHGVGDFVLPAKDQSSRRPRRRSRTFQIPRSEEPMDGPASRLRRQIGIALHHESLLDFNEAARGPVPAPAFQHLAQHVAADWRTDFISSVPGIAYLTEYDRSTTIGRLDYRNLQLGFTATVSEGVSMYLSTSDGLIYSVPFGQSAGIWAVRAR
jgi:hypothetical protein